MKGSGEDASWPLALAEGYDAKRDRIEVDDSVSLKGRFAEGQRAGLAALEEFRAFEARTVGTLGKRIEDDG